MQALKCWLTILDLMFWSRLVVLVRKAFQFYFPSYAPVRTLKNWNLSVSSSSIFLLWVLFWHQSTTSLTLTARCCLSKLSRSCSRFNAFYFAFTSFTALSTHKCSRSIPLSLSPCTHSYTYSVFPLLSCRLLYALSNFCLLQHPTIGFCIPWPFLFMWLPTCKLKFKSYRYLYKHRNNTHTCADILRTHSEIPLCIVNADVFCSYQRSRTAISSTLFSFYDKCSYLSAVLLFPSSL